MAVQVRARYLWREGAGGEGVLAGFITPVGDAIYEAQVDESDGEDGEDRKEWREIGLMQ